MGLREEKSPNPPLLLDVLYCEENPIEVGDGEDDNLGVKGSIFPLFLSEEQNGVVEEDEYELDTLKSKEKKINKSINDDGCCRKEAIEWMIKVKSHYGFSGLTCVLAVNYFDRFVLSSSFQQDKPWMTQLAAVACLSLAAKVEETQVPLLIDLQIEECKYVFEARTIKRMELLVLATLEWKMNPVTPVSFFDYIMKRIGFTTNLHWEFMWRCESLLLLIIVDSRTIGSLPSILAAATMLNVIKEIEPCQSLEYQNKLMDVLKISKEDVCDCYKLVEELSSHESGKRKRCSVPSSPNGVFDMSFSCESSNDSWAVGSSLTSSPEPLLKKTRRAKIQQMRILPPLNRVPMEAITSPH